MSLPLSFRVGELYSNEEIHRALNVGNTGGVRPCLGDNQALRRLVVLASVPNARQAAENPYHDRIEGDILTYTGSGRQGNQSLAGVNKRLVDQLDVPFPIYGFVIVGSRRDRSLGPKRWRFLGLLEYLYHYPESQIDGKGELRQVWLFELKIHREPSEIWIDHDLSISAQVISRSREREHIDEADRQIESGSAGAEPPISEPDFVQIEKIRSRMLNTAPDRFEVIIRDTLARSGFEHVTVTKYSQDGGVDVNAYAGNTMWPIRDLLLQVQAKRWLHTVGRKEVAELRGSLQPFARGSIVTTSHFSKAAMLEAQEQGKNPIVLIDGYQFASLVHRLRIQMD